MASVLGLTALLGAMKCGAGDPPPQGDGGGSGLGVNDVSPGAKQTKNSGISRFSVLLTMLLLVLGLAGTANAQSSASELEDGGAAYVIMALSGDTYDIRIVDTGSGHITVSGTNISAIPNYSIGSKAADDSTGYYPGAAKSEVVLMDTTAGNAVAIYIGTSGQDSIGLGNHDCEIVFGMDDDDDIYGTGGTGSVMLIFGGDGADSIVADDEIDEIWGGFRSIRYNSTGTDYIECGAGADVVFCDDLTGGNEVHGDAGADDIYGGRNDDFLYGEGGADNIWGGSGSDYIEGNAGCDDLIGDEGAGTFGMGFANTIHANEGDDEIHGGADDDFIRGNGGDDYLTGGTEDDAIDGESGVDDIEGGSESDWLHDIDSVGGNSIDGGSGDDLIHVLDFNQSDGVQSGSGDDTVHRDLNITIPIVDSYSNSGGTDTVVTSGNPAGYAPSGNGTQDAFENLAFATHWGGGRSCP